MFNQSLTADEVVWRASELRPGPVPALDFSNASLLQTSQVTGNFDCTLGADAVCPVTANVSGTANRGLCTKP